MNDSNLEHVGFGVKEHNNPRVLRIFTKRGYAEEYKIFMDAHAEREKYQVIEVCRAKEGNNHA
ncbi:MAG: hypothetical protein R8M45_00420 [Ghiorsea sp.]